MRVTYVPQRRDGTIIYSFDGETITATMGEQTDVFDFSSLPNGETTGITSVLNPCPVLTAKRVDGELHVTLLRSIGPRPGDPAGLEEWKRLWTDVEEVR